ncbi:MAG: 3D domain-containing protein [Lachnospirales bacterium]
MADKLKVVIAICFFVIASVITTTANDESTKIVNVEREGEVTEYETEAETYLEFFTEIGYDMDTLVTEVDLAETLKSNNTIAVSYNIPITIFIDDEEEEIVYFPDGVTIQEVLDSLNTENRNFIYELGNETQVLNEAYTLSVKSVRTETLEEEVVLPFDVEYIEDSTLTLGTEIVEQVGVDGTGLAYIDITYYAGTEIAREEVETVTTLEPVKQILRVGTRAVNTLNVSNVVIPPALSGYSIDVNNLVYKTSLVMNASAYTAGAESTGKSVGDSGYGVTATGKKAEKGVVAVDPDTIPLGTKMYIEGYGLAIAADTGGSIDGHKIDVFYDNLSDALVFGRKKVNVYILE